MAGRLLTPVQQRGRDALQRLGLPTRREESWRLTDLRRLQQVADLPAASAALRPGDLPPAAPGVLRLVLDGIATRPTISRCRPGWVCWNRSSLNRLGRLDRCPALMPSRWSRPASCHQVLALRGVVSCRLELVVCSGDSLTTGCFCCLRRKHSWICSRWLWGQVPQPTAMLLRLTLAGTHLNHGCLATAMVTPPCWPISLSSRSRGAIASRLCGWSLGRLEPRVVRVDGQASTKLRGWLSALTTSNWRPLPPFVSMDRMGRWIS